MDLHIAHATIHINGGTELEGRLVELTATPGRSAQAAPVETGTWVAPTLGQIWPGEGGLYVGTVPAMLGLPARHLIASKNEATLAWSGYGNDVVGASSHTDGPANTHALLSDSERHPAAAWCENYTDDGHHDFHLPSRFDLLMAYLNAPQCFEKEGWYWSSTQSSRYGAFAQDFEYGGSDWSGKGHELRVRAFRWIPLSA